MLLDEVRRFYKKHLNTISIVLIGTIAIVWFVLPLYMELLDNTKKIALTGAIILLLCSMLADYLTGMNEAIMGLYNIRINKDQTEANTELIAHVRKNNPAEAYLLEYSATTVKDLLGELRKGRTKIFLLLKNPATAIDTFQKERICASIKDLALATSPDYENIAIKCYDENASLRGRKLGEVINIGWYTYERTGSTQIWGHNNPLITLLVDRKEGQFIDAMFKRVFENLWLRASDLQKICNECNTSNCNLKDGKILDKFTNLRLGIRLS